ncbi:MAG TPA: N-acetyltransferase [Ktedonobacterales bacterium]|jgi:ribosomal protein S18 acetylase RimI-like enzyme
MTSARETAIRVYEGGAADRERAATLVQPGSARGRMSLAMLREGRGQLWLAVEQGAEVGDGAEELVGLLLGDTQTDSETDLPVGYIQELLVHPAYRRRGVAMHLLDAAERYYFETRGYTTVALVTTPDNEGAVRLYRSRGYGVDQVRLRKRRSEDA